MRFLYLVSCEVADKGIHMPLLEIEGQKKEARWIYFCLEVEDTWFTECSLISQGARTLQFSKLNDV